MARFGGEREERGSAEDGETSILKGGHGPVRVWRADHFKLLARSRSMTALNRTIVSFIIHQTRTNARPHHSLLLRKETWLPILYAHVH